MSEFMDAVSMGIRDINQEMRNLAHSGTVRISNASHISGLGAGMRRGDFLIEGNAGDYLGILNSGATFSVEGDCGRFLGDGMTSGSIHVNGNAAEGTGEYCYGGNIRIDGNTGDFMATMNKGASIAVTGDVGSDAATYMLAGEVIVLGNAGDRLGNYLIGGTIYILGSIIGLGNNAKTDKLRSKDVDRLAQVLDEMGFRGAPRQFTKIVPESTKPFYRKRADELEVR